MLWVNPVITIFVIATPAPLLVPETVATTAIDDFVKTFKVAADPEDLGVIFQKTLSDDLDVFRGNTRALYKSLDKKLRKTNPYAVNISVIKKEAQKRKVMKI